MAWGRNATIVARSGRYNASGVECFAGALAALLSFSTKFRVSLNEDTDRWFRIRRFGDCRLLVQFQSQHGDMRRLGSIQDFASEAGRHADLRAWP